MRKKRAEIIDDGSVVAPMNVDGMPWYEKTRGQDFSAGEPVVPIILTRRENIAFAFGVLKAVLLVTLIFMGTLFAFILFCTNVWLR